jgi:NADH-quinone oxidoreductase subunit M
VGEFLILLGTWTSNHRWWAVAAATGVILSAIYMLSLVQRVFWNPLTREENRRLPEIRVSELVAAGVLVVPMVWIGVRPNDFLDRLRPSIEEVRRSVATRKVAAARPRRALRLRSGQAPRGISPKSERFLTPPGLGMTGKSPR